MMTVYWNNALQVIQPTCNPLYWHCQASLKKLYHKKKHFGFTAKTDSGKLVAKSAVAK